MVEILIELSKSLMVETFEFSCVLQSIGFARNSCLHGSRSWGVISQVEFAQSFIHEFQTSNGLLKTNHSTPITPPKWPASSHGSFKLNYDASVKNGEW
ncbi:hypothetical protein TorRG33x02_312340 [Trema orientale]|uniref:Uncharacterized protein n=1 Tax=Trema orientale TaxID=63057 RepID=A0A2P5BQB4_TREOI|nr:hypothetical protein TorRG33x02_312340 [Trema orientale]